MTPRLHAAVLALATFTIVPSLAAAQTPPPQAAGATANAALLNDAAFQSLAQVRGKQAWITTTDGDRRKTYVVSVALSGVTVADTAHTTREIALDRIVTVETVTNWRSKRLIRGGLIGFGAGFGSIALVTLSCWDDECEPTLVPALGFGALGAGIGVGIGALMNLHGHADDVVYDARRSTTKFNVAPILAPTRKGVAVSLTWR
jgi:hypothetical protein